MSETAKAIVEVLAVDVQDNGSVFCPNPKMPLWSSHPKVFIDLSHEGRGRCPYCGTTYQLAAGVKIAAGH